MNSKAYVDELIQKLKDQGMVLAEVAWQTALACVGWAYIYGAKGQECTPAYRRKRYSEEHPTIKSACKNFSGTGTCSGCKWYPDNQRTRTFDCRGFTYWILKAVYNWDLYGETTVTQWGKADNWRAKGTIDTMPQNVLCCLFQYDDSKRKMVHTGFGLNNETIECQKGVEYHSSRNKKWTHWAVAQCVEGEVPVQKPTLRRGDSGEYVTLMQTELIAKGYDCGSSGADGKFGKGTESAVRQFQADHGLTVDGICGAQTWNALDAASTELYTVHIPHLTKYKADALIAQYGGAWMTKE